MESTPRCCSSLKLSDAKSGPERKGRGKERQKTFDRFEEVSWSAQISPIYVGERVKMWSKNVGIFLAQNGESRDIRRTSALFFSAFLFASFKIGVDRQIEVVGSLD
jgi:hypothetical protein